jgi:hypothetical protein
MAQKTREIAGLREASARISEESPCAKKWRNFACSRTGCAELARFREEGAKISQEQAKSEGEITQL